jgi:hypothetical protein
MSYATDSRPLPLSDPFTGAPERAHRLADANREQARQIGSASSSLDAMTTRRL